MVSGSDDVVLSIEGLTRSYDGLVAVDDLSLDVRRGEVFGLLGPNGAGKTTTVKVICGLIEGDAGEVTIDGRSLRQDLRGCRQSMGLCPQELVIWESLTCFEQLQFVGELYDVPRGEAQERASYLLSTMGLRDRSSSLAGTLSGGMKRRLNLTLALMHEPPLLILDEPQAGLDPQSRILVRDFIRSLTPRTTVILTTHDMDEADRLSDRIAIMDHGRLLVTDTPERLKTRIGPGDVMELTVSEEHDAVLDGLRDGLPENVQLLARQHGTLRLVGTDLLRTLPALLNRFRVHGVEVEDMVIRKKTLEDVFVELTGRGLRE
jgi:ABC-2 type transport system ATP-binding protein